MKQLDLLIDAFINGASHKWTKEASCKVAKQGAICMLEYKDEIYNHWPREFIFNREFIITTAPDSSHIELINASLTIQREEHLVQILAKNEESTIQDLEKFGYQHVH